jgi:hypothetical protein
MSIKQNGGVFGRNPTFNDVTIEGQLTFDGDIDINSDLTIEGTMTANDVNITDTTPNLKFTDTDGNHLANFTQSGSHLYIDNDSTGDIRFRVDGNQDRLKVNSTGIDVIGIATMSGGVYLGGTGAANLLDDYEEGTWTPTVKDNSDNSATASTATGHYTKIGREVHIVCELDFIDTTGLVSGDQVRISGIPFNAATLTNNVQWFNVMGKSNVLTTSDSVAVSIQDTFGYLRLKKAEDNLGVWLAVSALTSGTAKMKFDLTYCTS